MYTYYVLRSTQTGNTIEVEDEINEEQFLGVDLDDGPAIINHLMKMVHQKGSVGDWEECELTDSFFNREDNYINHNGRWMRRSDAPWRKDRNN